MGTHLLSGSASVRRVGRLRFPAHELVQDGEVVARLGRSGWMRIYMGRGGQRVELADGTRWRVRARGSAGTMRPVVVDAAGRLVASAGIDHETFGINGKDYALTLHPLSHSRFGTPDRWALHGLDEDVAVVRRHPLGVDAAGPVHLGAVLLAFVLIRFGLPEQSAPLIPAFRWGG